MKAKAQAAMHGEGLYIYQNITNSELRLPRPTRSGRLSVGPREKFMGDSYYKSLKDVICLQEIESPMSQQPQILLNEVPPTVTTQGTIEVVVAGPAKPLNEQEGQQPEVLLTEAPLEGVRILR
jgi:hypothetical protein